MSELFVALGKGNLGQIRSQGKRDWNVFVSEYLAEFYQSDVTMAEFAAMDREQKAAIKGANGWYVGGRFDKNDNGVLWRTKSFLIGRSFLSMDLDHLGSCGMTVEDITDELDLLKIEYVLYSTASSTPGDIRLRLVIPLAKGIKPELYQPIARWIAGLIGIEAFDHTGFEEARLMYMPVALADGPKIFIHKKGDFLDPKFVIDQYEDVHDFATWPSSEREGGARVTDLKAEDPTQKRGPIGAFCRCFSIQDAIERWLTDHFEAHDDHTYLPAGSSGAPGARVYDDGLFLYNNHETGITSKKNLNAFDLVRLCLYGELDPTDDPEEITKAPSYKAMVDFALQQPEVVSDLSEGEFADVDATMDPTAGGAAPEHTFDAVASAIGELPDGAATRAETRMMLMRVANARFSPSDERAMIRMLQPKYEFKPTTKDMEQELKDLRQQATAQDDDGEIHDLELELLEEFETEHFPNGTIKRINGKYWVHQDGLWAMVPDEIIAGLFAETVLRIRKERPDDAREIAALVGESKTSALTGSLHRLMANRMAAREAGIEDPLKLLRRFDLPVINCRNKTIWYNADGTFRVADHDPKDFMTTRVDAVYDPEAECPLTDAFIKKICAQCDDPGGMEQFLWELIGYIMNSSRWLKIWVLFFGETNTGKSTLAELISKMLGGASIEKSLYSLDTKRSGEFAMSAFIGKQLFIDDDLDKGAMLPDGAIKRLSEAKTIQAPIKFADDIRFTSLAFPLVCSNHWPRTADISDAFVNRTLVVKFISQFTTDADDQVKANMMKETSGILNKGMFALSDLRARGHFALPIDMIRANEEMMTNANPVARFAASMLEREDKHHIKPLELFESYREWHYDEYDSRTRPLDKGEFYRRADAKLGGRRRAGKSGEPVYVNWKLRSMASPIQREFDADLSDFEEDDLLE